MDKPVKNMYYLAMTDSRLLKTSSQKPAAILLADHYFEPPGYRIQRVSGLKDWFVTFTHAGQGRYLWENQQYICNRGDLVVLPAGHPHDYSTASTDKKWQHYWVHFDPGAAWLRWLPISVSPLEPYICHVTDSISETRMVENFEQLLLHFNDGQKLLAQDVFEDILLIAIRQYAEAICPHADARISTVVQYLFLHLNETIELPMLAEMVSMSSSRLAHLFKEQMNESIMQMLLRLRLRYAVRLLHFTSLPIGDISAETGFQSQFYFSRRFKAQFGIGPAAYRKRLALP